ncbi:trehalose synthase [Novosphingobium endophyticum]|uniref:Trehalose synthase n=2 Tax=Novosphingobium endophyticum TaxID=1955250 RepID=A0A916TVM2_9SPHN|nr:trehalose synthase [Novosphingobium endophyticum]
MVQSLWYKEALIYCLNVESFMDGNGDGIGDFRGLIRRLDYLEGIGAGAVWLMPFQPSPRKDHGYDIADYYGVDPRFGTLGDFAEFTHECEQRGIRVLMDLVFNHTSNQHPWFQESRSSPDSPRRDWYIWSDKEPPNRHQGMVFPGLQDALWDYDKKAKAWYFHRFFKFQPDLNMANPEVQAEILKVIGFWIKLGVSGFRLDAAPFIIATDEHEADTHEMEFEFLRDMRRFSQFRRGDSVLLAEANVPPEHAANYFGASGERLHMMFDFHVNPRIFYALATGDAEPLKQGLEDSRVNPPGTQWCHFLRNHDELDLSRLSEEQQAKVFERMAPDDSMRVFDRGIRRRLAPMLNGDRRKIELANSVLLSLPGTPMLRYGEEIGMGEDLSIAGRGAIRTPMQWNDDRHAGFTTAETSMVPLIEDGPYGFRQINVADQRRDPESLLNWTERVIRLRKELPEIGYGEFDILNTNPEILAMRFRWKGACIVIVHNFAEEPREVVLDLGDGSGAGSPLVSLLSYERDEPTDDDGYTMVLEPCGYRWFRVGDPSEGLARKDR